MKKKSFILSVIGISIACTSFAQSWVEGGNFVGTSLTASRLGNRNTTGTNLDLQLITKDQVRMRIMDDGRIGVGVFNPSSLYKMDMAGSLNLNSGLPGTEKALFVNAKEAVFLSNSYNYFSWGYGGAFNFFDKGVTIGFTNAPAIAPPSKGLIVEGNVGFGTSAPGVNVDIKGASNPAFSIGATGIGASAVLGIVSTGWSYSSNTVPGDVVFGPKGGASHDLILSAQNVNNGSIRFKTGNIGTDTEHMTVNYNGNVGIGVTNPQNKLEVCGLVRAKEVIVETMWCDYVFEKNYRLRPLSEVEAFITANKHLPEIPPAADVEANGIKVGEVNSKLLLKVEELTLYMIEADKQIKALQAENAKIKSELETVKNDSGK